MKRTGSFLAAAAAALIGFTACGNTFAAGRQSWHVR